MIIGTVEKKFRPAIKGEVGQRGIWKLENLVKLENGWHPKEG